MFSGVDVILYSTMTCSSAERTHLLSRAQTTERGRHGVRIERMLFDGAPVPKDGVIRPDLSRPGHGLQFKRDDAERFAI
jgi:hypothetical protein